MENLTLNRALICLAAWVATMHPVQAQSINLMTTPRQGTVDYVAAQNITGMCGGAVVRVLSVTRQDDDTFALDLDSGDVIVRSNDSGSFRELSLKPLGVLSDHNGISCVEGSLGTRLLVWTKCGGSACGDEYGFIVIDPKSARVFSGEEDGCDEDCASRLVGSDLPLRLNNRQ